MLTNPTTFYDKVTTFVVVRTADVVYYSDEPAGISESLIKRSGRS